MDEQKRRCVQKCVEYDGLEVRGVKRRGARSGEVEDEMGGLADAGKGWRAVAGSACGLKQETHSLPKDSSPFGIHVLCYTRPTLTITRCSLPSRTHRPNPHTEPRPKLTLTYRGLKGED